MKRLFLLPVFSLLAVSAAQACPGGRLVLNDDTALTGTSIAAIISGGETLESKDYVGKLVNIGDSKGVITHVVTVLGVKEDKGGILYSVYLIQDKKDGSEKVVTVNTNYAGNGAYARGIEPEQTNLTRDPVFKTAYSVGCGQ